MQCRYEKHNFPVKSDALLSLGYYVEVRIIVSIDQRVVI